MLFLSVKRKTRAMRKLTVLSAALLMALSSSGSIAKQRNTSHKHGYNYAIEPYLTPEAAQLKAVQRNWPGTPMCDEGGYRILPCYRRH